MQTPETFSDSARTALYLRPAAALRHALAEGYGGKEFRRDAMAGLVVGVVALPLSMALAIACGAPPQHGLYTAIVAGGLTALLGGSRVQVSGPTAAFVVILAPVTMKFGLGGLLLATMLAGVILMLMGLFRLGRLIEFIPYPVTTGFTTGIAVVIATLQVRDLMGLEMSGAAEHTLDRLLHLAEAMPTFSAADFAIGVLTLAILIVWPRVTKKVPPALVALVIGAGAAYVAGRAVDDFSVATIADRFTYEISGRVGRGIPQLPPLFIAPWTLAGPNGQPLVLSIDLFRSLLPPAFAIAMLGAIESLLSAVVADGMTGFQHDPDAELFAQGVGNVVAPLFGGFAATGAIARTAANIRSGGRSPVAAIVHAAFVLAAVLVLAPLLGYLPMASLAALLLIVAWNMAEIRHFKHVVRVAPRSDTLVLITCFVLTVVFDMVVAVSVGTVLAAMLFMKRMAEVADVKLISQRHEVTNEPLPHGVIVYEIGGPLFFGAAQKAMSALRTLGNGVSVVILDLRAVPVMDATGLVNLESTLERLARQNVKVILAGVQKQPLHLLARSHLKRDRQTVSVCGTFDAALDLARWHAAEQADEASRVAHSS